MYKTIFYRKYIKIIHLGEFLTLALYFIVSSSNFITCGDLKDFQKNIPARLVWASVGNNVNLTCDLTPPTPQDSVKVLLWFKDTTGIPLYSLDSRGGSIRIAPHSAIANDLGQRLFFTIGDNLKDSYLQIRDVKPTDGGIYRCRVDFFNYPSRNHRINISLVELPQEPRIFDAQGKEISHIGGPFREGFELFLCCQVKGGRPLPKVTWWKAENELKSASHTSFEKSETVIVNQLLISNLSRDYFGSKFECRAQGTKLVKAVIKEISVQIYLKPVWIKIITPNQLLRAGHIVLLRCDSWGSFPAAKIIWLLDGEPIRNSESAVQNYKQDLNMSTNTLTFRVTAENDNTELKCRSSNPWFSGHIIEDKRIIHVAYPPSVSVHLANEEPTRLIIRAEGQNVTLKCRAKARPQVTLYLWFKNGMRMSGECKDILQLTHLERESSGQYSCGALNAEGETRSSSIALTVQYSPRCKAGTEQTSVGAVSLNSIPVKCEIEADPSDHIKFSWTYNNTRNVSPILNSRIQSNGLISTVAYLPQSDSELITLACWASNTVGRQAVPCLVHILPAYIPESPKACEIHNDSTFEVICLPGNDGGLTQYFVLEVISDDLLDSSQIMQDLYNSRTANNEISTLNDEATSAPLFRLQSSFPQFKINNLKPKKEYTFVLYAVNAKGRSNPPVIIDRVQITDQTKFYENLFLSEDPTPAGTTYQIGGGTNIVVSDIGGTLSSTHEEKLTLLMLIAIVSLAAVIITLLGITGILVTCKIHSVQQERCDIKKHTRIIRNNISSMYVEDEDTNEQEQVVECNQDIRPRLISFSVGPNLSTNEVNSQHNYSHDGFIQFAQPNLINPDLILPRGELEFTTLNPILK